MSLEVLLLLATATLAVVAVAAAVVAVRAVRRLDARAADVVEPVEAPDVEPQHAATEPAAPEESTRPGTEIVVREAPVVRLVEGRVVASPTRDQVVATALGRPAARASIVAAGLAHALRPESRDRIQALMRREFRRRRRVRQRVARRAARQVPAQALHPDQTWLGGGPPPRPEYPRVVGE